MPTPPLPLVERHHDRAEHVAIKMGGVELTYGELDRAVNQAAAALAAQSSGAGVIAVPAVPEVETVVATLAALRAGVTVTPLNPGAGTAELAHMVDDCRPALVACRPDLDLPAPVSHLARLGVTVDTGSSTQARHGATPASPGPDDVALVVYTSGTTGPPKGVMLSHQALAHDLDSLADAWHLTADDVLVQSLPLFHVHGLVLGVLGPLRLGATVHHLGRFDAHRTIDAFDRGGTVLYGVPTMYHRLADAVTDNKPLARSLGNARLLVSGSAGLPAHDRQRLADATGQAVLERYGMTETLITCAMTVGGNGGPGTVGPPLPGVELRLVTEEGAVVEADDHATVGEIEVRGPTLFNGYLGQPEATAACFDTDGWFRTGDLANWSDGGAVTISGRRSVDLIKTGGYRVGAGEVENALLSHPGVAEVAVTAEPDPDLGEQIVAWVVPVSPEPPPAGDLVDHVSRLLSPHKRPRSVRFVSALPRNELGKVLKRQLSGDPVSESGA
ncbi:MAG: AMP-binding protein [Microthrixaceae bacterium]|jgi:malonyl-CoA/methylmalonyl-CoA synthetase|nr:AMP-binding protein [Microthrixaceae bacterium]